MTEEPKTTTPQDVLRLIAEDAQNDAETLDGLEFTGRTLGPRMGEMYAMIKALAEIMLELHPDPPKAHAEDDEADAREAFEVVANG